MLVILYYADNEQSNLFQELSNISKGKKPTENFSFLENVRILLKAEQNFLNSFKSIVFPIENSTEDSSLDPKLNPSVLYTPKQTRARSRTPEIKISRNFVNRNRNFVNEVRNDDENMNSEISKEYVNYQNPSLLEKYLLKANQVKNNQTINQAINLIKELRNVVIRKEILENGNGIKTINILKNSSVSITNKKIKDSKI